MDDLQPIHVIYLLSRQIATSIVLAVRNPAANCFSLDAIELAI